MWWSFTRNLSGLFWPHSLVNCVQSYANDLAIDVWSFIEDVCQKVGIIFWWIGTVLKVFMILFRETSTSFWNFSFKILGTKTLRFMGFCGFKNIIIGFWRSKVIIMCFIGRGNCWVFRMVASLADFKVVKTCLGFVLESSKS